LEDSMHRAVDVIGTRMMPATILALIERVRNAEARAERAEAALGGARGFLEVKPPAVKMALRHIDDALKQAP
jgi:hypothetical protein